MKFVAYLLFILLLCVPASALTVELPANISVGESFNVVVKLNESSVVGLTFKLPDGLVFVNSSVPYKISDGTVALAIVNESDAICTFKALKGGDFELKIRWTDFLSGKNGTIVKHISVGEKSITPTVTPTRSMPTPTPTTPHVKLTPTKEAPGFELFAAILAIILALRRW